MAYYDPFERRRSLIRLLRDMVRDVFEELSYYEYMTERLIDEIIDYERIFNERIESIRQGVIEPHYSIIDRGDHVEIIVDVSGARKETTRITILRDSILIEASIDSATLERALGDTIYYRHIKRVYGRIVLPFEVDPSTIKWERRGSIIVFRVPKK